MVLSNHRKKQRDNRKQTKGQKEMLQGLTTRRTAGRKGYE